MKIDDVRKLHMRRYREELGHFLVEGEHLVLELQKAAVTNVALRSSRLLVTHAYERWDTPFEKTVIGAAHMARLADTENPQGILAVVPMMPAPAPRAGERAIYLHEIQDPGNLGTILRTLAWFGGWRCLLGPGSVDPFNPKVVRATAGAIFHVAVEMDVTLQALSARFARIASLDRHGASVSSAQFRSFDCYVFGNEARGLPHEGLAALRTEAFAIRGAGVMESLNLATAVNMCLYELNRS